MDALNEIKGFINFCTNKEPPNNQKIGCTPHNTHIQWKRIGCGLRGHVQTHTRNLKANQLI